jgi:hypothetical protein
LPNNPAFSTDRFHKASFPTAKACRSFLKSYSSNKHAHVLIICVHYL